MAVPRYDDGLLFQVGAVRTRSKAWGPHILAELIALSSCEITTCLPESTDCDHFVTCPDADKHRSRDNTLMAKSKLIESTDKLVEVFDRSGLLEAKQLEAVKKLATTAEDPIQVARAVLKKGWLTKWQASQLLSGFHQLKLGKYRLADHLGKGELGNVYLAENPKLGRKVALKTLSKEFTSDPELVKRFLAEASAAASLDHRNIVHIHDVSSEGQRHYVVMEYVTGQDLQRRVDTDGQLSFDEATGCIRQAAEGLQHAHEQGVIHRDIKPANVMLDDQGVTKILDIGVGQLRQSESKSSDNTGEMMMSAVAYMAPEHARDEEVDKRCDIYSLGAVLYFALTGRVPFAAKTDSERATIKATKQPVPIAKLRADVPEALASLCERMMALKPDDRFASMSEVIDALASIDNSPAAAASDDDLDDLEELDTLEPLEVEMDDDVDLSSEAATTGSPESASGEGVSEENDEPKQTDEPKQKLDSKPAAGGIAIDLGDGAKPAATAAPANFAINTKRRKKKKPAPAAAKTQGPEPEAATEPEAEPIENAYAEPAASSDKPEPAEPTAEKAGVSKGLLIGGIAAAALMMLIVIGGGAMYFLSGGDDEVAQATPEPVAQAADGTTEAVGDSAADEVPTDDTAPVPVASSSDSTGTPPTDTSANPELGPADPESAAGEVIAAPVKPAAVATEPVATSGSETPAATDAAAMPATTPEEKPAEPAPTDPKPEEPKPEPKPEPKKPAEPKKKAPPKPKTFVFQPAVDLPTPAADAPELTLGQVNIRPEDAVFISMDGGDIAAAGKVKFALQNAQDGVAPRDWEFYFEDGKADPVVIATMSLPKNALTFKWTPAAVDIATATNLRNCGLRITAGQDKPQDLALRIATKVPPSTIELEKSGTVKLPMEGAPDRSSLKLEVTVKGHKAMVEPTQIELAKNGGGYIYFGENREQAALALKLDTSLTARGVNVKTDPYFMVPVETSPLRLNKGSLKKYESVGDQIGVMQNQILQGEKMANDKKTPPPQQLRMKQQLQLMKQEVAMRTKTAEKMTQLKTDMAAVGAGATLQFRVFSDTFEKQIDLIITDPKAAPVAP